MKTRIIHATTLTVCTLGFMLPTGIALARGHRNAGPIAVVNLLLGWTLLFWVVALVWAMVHQTDPIPLEPEPIKNRAQRCARYIIGLREAGLLDAPVGPPMRAKLGPAIAAAQARL